ncbi:MAG: hypothetical protein MZU84_02220 [Sphingobacterium sp.]|nr:hypothetical protein [Sphingobacterium sp.]
MDETPEHCRGLKLHHPHPDQRGHGRAPRMSRASRTSRPTTLDMLFPVDGDGRGPGSRRWTDLSPRPKSAIAAGRHASSILTDRDVDRNARADSRRCWRPPACITTSSAKALRNRAGIIVETGEAREVHAFRPARSATAPAPSIPIWRSRPSTTCLARTGCSRRRHAGDRRWTTTSRPSTRACSRPCQQDGHLHHPQLLRRARSSRRVGLCTGRRSTSISPGTASRIGGIGLDEHRRAKRCSRHAQAFPDRPRERARCWTAGGDYQCRQDGEHHLWQPGDHLQAAAAPCGPTITAPFKEYHRS